MLWAPCSFRASQPSLRSERSGPLRLRELLAQGPSELEVTVKEASLWFPSSSPSPSRQRRVGAGRARAEQVQPSASPSQEQEGPSSRGGPAGGEGQGQRCLCSPGPGRPAPPPGVPTLTDHRETQGDVLGAPSVLSSAGEFAFVARLHSGQLQDPGLPRLGQAQSPAPLGPAQCGRRVAVGDTDQEHRFPFQDWKR